MSNMLAQYSTLGCDSPDPSLPVPERQLWLRHPRLCQRGLRHGDRQHRHCLWLILLRHCRGHRDHLPRHGHPDNHCHFSASGLWSDLHEQHDWAVFHSGMCLSCAVVSLSECQFRIWHPRLCEWGVWDSGCNHGHFLWISILRICDGCLNLRVKA
ncbi:hypothetical protein M430DRAFT_197712 [Amorphotheca resinae ATCC 22711]|uniref:Uncharacterized protein n=1 Tax=Amorphotheca resinae ATCC 22711 TaxID=857342 RepID=A0A2T3B9P1_AMORE|nr:hypothetical protein M430DRAFT_197712 [Amorphotheca resinae ATCC 22711]PSS25042.1 hypothetical protein M430DRAFT_197712 [Amorphotheca resinae ATCC 22711]